MSKYYGMWKLMKRTQQTGHNNQGERRKEMVFCGCQDTPGSPFYYERNQKNRQVSGTG